MFLVADVWTTVTDVDVPAGECAFVTQPVGMEIRTFLNGQPFIEGPYNGVVFIPEPSTIAVQVRADADMEWEPAGFQIGES